MNIIVKDGDTFRKIINCLKDLITDSGELVFDSSGISMKSIDTTKVVLIDILLDQEAFDKYEVEPGPEAEDIRLAFNFENFSNSLKLSKSMKIGMIHKLGDDKVSIKMNEHNNKKIQFNMALSETDKLEREVPEIDYSVKVYIDTNEFQKTIKDLSSFGKRCTITVSGSEITFSVKGDAGTGEICISDAEIEYSETTDEEEEFTADFNIKYLNFFAKAGLSNEITLKFAKGVPFCFEYQLDFGHVRFYLTELLND